MKERYQTDISTLQQQQVDAVSVLTETYEAQISALKGQINLLETKQLSTVQECQKTWKEQLISLQEQLDGIRSELYVKP